MDKRQEILEKYQEFQSYLESIDLEDLRQQYNRKELSEFRTTIHAVNLRSLPYEISKLTKKMKEDEYPELLGVHHFPIIKEIPFLSEKQKLELDQFLLKHRVGNYVSGLWRVTRDETTRKQLEAWLLEHGVLEENYAALCPNCHDGYISTVMKKEEKDSLKSQLDKYKETQDWEIYEELMKTLEYVCMECDSEFEPSPDTIDSIRYKTLIRMKMKRDDSLDHV